MVTTSILAQNNCIHDGERGNVRGEVSELGLRGCFVLGSAVLWTRELNCFILKVKQRDKYHQDMGLLKAQAERYMGVLEVLQTWLVSTPPHSLRMIMLH